MVTKIIRLTLIITLIIFGIWTPDLSAASNNTKELPTKITSDLIDIKRKSHKVDFIGHVVVTKGGDKMLSNQMEVLYEEENQALATQNAIANQSKIKQINAKDNVLIFSNNMIASGDLGYYNPKDETFTLEKNVVFHSGKSIAKGEKFVYNLTTKKGNFVGNRTEETLKNKSGRVSFIIHNDDLKNKNATQKKGNQ